MVCAICQTQAQEALCKVFSCCPLPACSAFAGYAAGLVATIVVMNVFKVSQHSFLFTRKMV